MKRKKAFFIIEQIVIILLINYLILIESGFIYKTHWLSTFAFAIIFFHLGTFMSLYATITAKIFTKEKEQFIFNFNFFVYLSFLGLILYHNCHVATNDLVINYCFGLYMLANAIIFLFETYFSYKKYTASLIINN
ncbi:MAG: hypothetical protein K9H41_05825 [Bacteroidia bacterium]|nr:hypothetical protein [Bacteroidia bacterium]